jgi:hypothetical protein
VIYLNMLYDGTNWQEKTAFNPKIKNAAGSLDFEFNIRKKDYEENTFILITNTPKESDYNIEWHGCVQVEELVDTNLIRIKFNSQKLERCGYFDWNLVK